MKRLLTLLFFLAASLPSIGQSVIFEIVESKLSFFSEAPEELIQASSGKLKGLLDLTNRTFAFKVDIGSFEGFNSPLQKEHFNENYMESTLFPVAVYSGKIIENVNLQKEGSYHIRTKGKLVIHGVSQERIIKVKVTSKSGRLKIESDFPVLLTEHNIKIPRVVNQKLAQEIKVSVDAALTQRRS